MKPLPPWSLLAALLLVACAPKPPATSTLAAPGLPQRAAPAPYSTAHASGAVFTPICRRVGEDDRWDCESFVLRCAISGCSTVERSAVEREVLEAMAIPEPRFRWRHDPFCYDALNGSRDCTSYVTVCAYPLHTDEGQCVNEPPANFASGIGSSWSAHGRNGAPLAPASASARIEPLVTVPTEPAPIDHPLVAVPAEPAPAEPALVDESSLPPPVFGSTRPRARTSRPRTSRPRTSRPSPSGGPVHVRGYYRRDGTYVGRLLPTTATTMTRLVWTQH